MASDAKLPSIIERWRPVLEMVALVLVIVVCVTMLGVTARSLLLSPTIARGAAPSARNAPSRTAALPKDPISFQGAAIKGNPNAPVAILGYSDFQCPFCVRFATGTFPELDKAYLATGKVSFAFKHLPIASIHTEAVKAAEASECAGRQGQFWAMHDRLFASPKQIGMAMLRSHGNALALNPATFDDCLKGQATSRVQADVEQANALGVTGTPTFFIGILQTDGRVAVTDRLVGALPLESFAQVIDSLLDKVGNSGLK